MFRLFLQRRMLLPETLFVLSKLTLPFSEATNPETTGVRERLWYRFLVSLVRIFQETGLLLPFSRTLRAELF